MPGAEPSGERESLVTRVLKSESFDGGPVTLVAPHQAVARPEVDEQYTPVS
jgi:hypothetical protein